jgi:nucleotide-binding universal stress UspA family protein
MNEIRQLLIHLNDDSLSREVLRMGAALARQHGAHPAALLAIEPAGRGAFLNAETASLAARLEAEHLAAHRRSAEAMVLEAAQAASLQIELTMDDTDPVDALIRASRGSDLLVLGQREPGTSGGLDAGASARLLTSAACPVLIVPYIGWTEAGGAHGATPAQRILVAWSDTRECARALRDALPLLQRAPQVEMVTYVHHDTEGGDRVPAAMAASAQMLRRHGVDPALTVRRSGEPTLGERMRRAWISDASVAEAMLSHAADMAADLIVMGGYGHPRAWELVLGGVTRTLLKTMTVPVFMSH